MNVSSVDFFVVVLFYSIQEVLAAAHFAFKFHIKFHVKVFFDQMHNFSCYVYISEM